MRKHTFVRFGGLAAIGLAGLALSGSQFAGMSPTEDGRRTVLPVPGPTEQVATFAGGCFWSMQKAFDGVPGVIRVTAGYAGGKTSDPSYEEVETGRTGHAESVQLIYEPAKVSYQQLLEIYWHHIDPLTPNAAFCDHGPQYRSIIFYRDPEQRRLAEASKQALDQSHRFPSPIVTAIQPATAFYAAEEYHQLFYKKNPVRYQAYVIGCGREGRIKELWGDARESRVSTRESGTGR